MHAIIIVSPVPLRIDFQALSFIIGRSGEAEQSKMLIASLSQYQCTVALFDYGSHRRDGCIISQVEKWLFMISEKPRSLYISRSVSRISLIRLIIRLLYHLKDHFVERDLNPRIRYTIFAESSTCHFNNILTYIFSDSVFVPRRVLIAKFHNETAEIRDR